MPLPGIQQFLQTKQAIQHNVQSIKGKSATDGVQSLNPLLGANNPFLLNNFGKSDRSARSNNEIGINDPLMRPMFLGYRDNMALYGGDRLFVLA